jgi:hypothetical protein
VPQKKKQVPTAAPIAKFTRWSLWEAEVLSKCKDPADLQKLIRQRQSSLDDDRAEADLVRQYFCQQISSTFRRGSLKKFRPDFDVIFLPNWIALDWLCQALDEFLVANKASTKLELLGISELRRGSSKDPKGNGCRGYVWTGSKASKNQKAVSGPWPATRPPGDDGRTTMGRRSRRRWVHQ